MELARIRLCIVAPTKMWIGDSIGLCLSDAQDIPQKPQVLDIATKKFSVLSQPMPVFSG